MGFLYRAFSALDIPDFVLEINLHIEAFDWSHYSSVIPALYSIKLFHNFVLFFFILLTDSLYVLEGIATLIHEVEAMSLGIILSC